jgi:hypothetical protein
MGRGDVLFGGLERTLALATMEAQLMVWDPAKFVGYRRLPEWHKNLIYGLLL